MSERILVIKLSAYNALQSSTIRMLAMVNGLIQLGYNVDLLTVKPHSAVVLNNTDEYSFLNEVNIVALETNQAYEKIVSGKKSSKKLDVLRKIYHRTQIYGGSKKIAEEVDISILPSREYDVVISVSDPKTSHIALERLLKQGLKCKKVVEYWGDPFYGDITQKALVPTFVLKREERKFLKLANRVVYTSPFTLEAQQKAYPDEAHKMVSIPTANIKERHFPENNSDVFTVGYYGAYFSHIRNIMPLYEASKSFDEKVQFIIEGDSDLELQNTENVRIIPRGVIENEEKTDLYVCVLNSSGTQIPGKVYHCAATNRPILIVLDGEYKAELRKYFEGFDRYYLCENNTDDISRSIKDIIRENASFAPLKALSPTSVAKDIINCSIQ